MTLEKISNELKVLNAIRANNLEKFTALISNNPSLLTKKFATKVMYAVNANIIQTEFDLLQQEGDNFQIFNGTILHFAAMYSLQIIEYIVEICGIDPYLPIDKLRPLHFNGINGKSDVALRIAKYLIDNADPNDPVQNYNSKDGITLLHTGAIGASKEWFELVNPTKFQIQYSDSKDKHPLHWAARFNNAAACELLLNLYPNKVNVGNKVGYTPMHEAAKWGNCAAIEALVKGGMNPKQRTSDKIISTPMSLNALTVAALCNQPEATKTLIKCGADVNEGDNTSVTPLMIACTFGKIEAVKALLKCKADSNQGDQNWRTPLFYATGSSHSRDIFSRLEDLLTKCGLENFIARPDEDKLVEITMILTCCPNIVLSHAANPAAGTVKGYAESNRYFKILKILAIYEAYKNFGSGRQFLEQAVEEIEVEQIENADKVDDGKYIKFIMPETIKKYVKMLLLGNPNQQNEQISKNPIKLHIANFRDSNEQKKVILINTEVTKIIKEINKPYDEATSSTTTTQFYGFIVDGLPEGEKVIYTSNSDQDDTYKVSGHDEGD